MAGSATYSNFVGSNNRRVIVVVGIIIESFGVPFFLRLIVEIGIRKQPETQDACRVAIDLGINPLRFWSHPLIQIETVSVFCILIAGLPETRLIDKAQVGVSRAALARIQHLQKIDQSIAFPRDPVPEVLVAARPQIPRVTAHDFLRRKLDAVIHSLENIGSNLGEVRRRFTRSLCVIDRLIFFAAAQEQAENQRAATGCSDAEMFHWSPREGASAFIRSKCYSQGRSHGKNFLISFASGGELLFCR